MSARLLLRKLRQEFLPSAQMKEFRRWLDAGGDECFRFNYDNVKPDSVILDVGGYHGQWTSDMVARYGCRAIVLEPVPEFYRAIGERFIRNPKVSVRNYGISAKRHSNELVVDGVYSSTIFRFGPKCRVDFMDARWFFENCLPSNIAVMSVNCEGGEYDFLPTLIDSGQIASVEEIEIQFHDFAPQAQAKRDAIRAGLSKTHNEIYSFPFVWERWQRKGMQVQEKACEILRDASVNGSAAPWRNASLAR